MEPPQGVTAAPLGGGHVVGGAFSQDRSLPASILPTSIYTTHPVMVWAAVSRGLRQEAWRASVHTVGISTTPLPEFQPQDEA